MIIKDLVQSTLDASGVPCYFGNWEATEAYPDIPPCYAVFTILSVPIKYLDDKVSEWVHYIYLEIWATSDYAAHRAAIETAMSNASFAIGENRERKEPGIDHRYNLSQTWVYSEDVI